MTERRVNMIALRKLRGDQFHRLVVLAIKLGKAL